jgi:ribosomal protein L37AE/L43A
MKTIYIKDLKLCDFCKAPAIYDGPTSSGPWANMCQACFDEQASFTADTVGYKLSLIKSDLKNRNNPPKPGIESLGKRVLKEVIFGTRDRVVKCPECKLPRTLEVDADGKFSCERCGQPITVKSLEELIWTSPESL